MSQQPYLVTDLGERSRGLIRVKKKNSLKEEQPAV